MSNWRGLFQLAANGAGRYNKGEIVKPRIAAGRAAIVRIPMFRIDAQEGVHFCDGMTRRDFLHAGSLAGFGLTLPGFFEAQARGLAADTGKNCVFLFLVGGPSQLDTFDMKPDAPSEIRGPYKPIRTNNPDIQISEIFPRTARHADKFSIVRTMYHTGAAVHDTGLHQNLPAQAVGLTSTDPAHCASGYGT